MGRRPEQVGGGARDPVRELGAARWHTQAGNCRQQMATAAAKA